MLHTKFRGNWSAGSGKEDFLKVFNIYGHSGHLGHVISIILQWILIAFKKFVIASIDKSIPTVVTLIQSNALALSPDIKIEIGKPITYCVIGSTRMIY